MAVGIYVMILCGVLGLSSAITPIISIVEPTTTNGHFDAVANRNIHITCRVSRRNGKTVYFYHQPLGSNHSIELAGGLATMNYRYTVDKPSSRRSNWRLKIKGIRQSDAGTYKCRVYLSTQDMFLEQRVYMRVTQPPVINPQLTSTSITLLEGEPLHLTCRAQGQPMPVVQWSRMGGALLPGGKVTSIGSELNVDHVTAADRGLYTCAARNTAGSTSLRIAVDVNFSPVITAEKYSYLQAPGFDKELICYIEARPRVEKWQLSWYKGSDQLVQGEHYKFTYMSGALNRVTWKLYITDIQTRDFGGYQCVAVTTEARAEADIMLERSSRRTYDVGQVLSRGVPVSSYYATLASILWSIATFK